MPEAYITMNLETIYEYVPPPLRASAWSIEQVGPDPENVRLYFQNEDGKYVQVELFGTTRRGTPKSAEFAEDLYDVTGHNPE